MIYQPRYKTKTVDISSAEILAMGATPIQLLPAAGVGKYYDIDKIIFKQTNADYTVPNALGIQTGMGDTIATISENLINGGYSEGVSILTDFSKNFPQAINTTIEFYSLYSTNPTLGTGTMQVIIRYRILDF